MSLFKRLRVSEDQERINWRNPRFSDWKLTWKDDSASESRTWDVHCNILVGGARAAQFFAGASREGAYESKNTELSKLLPLACRDHVDRALDFIYGDPLGEVVPESVMALMKIADVFQCPKLQNALLGVIEQFYDQQGFVEVLLKDACILDLPSLAETFVSLLPVERLAKLDFNLLEVDSISLMRAVAKRLSQSRTLQWERFVGHGEILGSSVRLKMACFGAEANRKGYWCHATSHATPQLESQTWKVRIDSALTRESGSSCMAFGVVAGEFPDLSTMSSDCHLFFEKHHAGACLCGITSKDSYKWRLTLSKGNAKWNSHNEAIDWQPRPAFINVVGGIFSVKLEFPTSQDMGNVEWGWNGTPIGILQQAVPYGSYSLGVELYAYDYERDRHLGVSLVDHVVS